MSDAPRAPEFPEGSTWINCASPPRIGELAGRVAIVHFWTAGSVHCHNVLPTLAWLEQRFAGRPLAVLGVHSGKFPGDRGEAAVRRAIALHGIEHPVLVDDDHAAWRAFGARAWPSLWLIDVPL